MSMRNIVIGVVLVAMFGWAVYNVAFQEEVAPEQESSADFDVVEDVAESDVETGMEPDDAEIPETGAVEIGLEQGNQAPDFELETLEGETVKLSDFQGQKVMLNFWASWCPPCRAEMPDMQRFYEDVEVQILAVNLTQTEDNISNVHEFVEEFELTFPIPLDEEIEVANQYKIQPIPTSYLIDSHGVIQQVAIGAMNYEMMVQQFSQMD